MTYPRIAKSKAADGQAAVRASGRARGGKNHGNEIESLSPGTEKSKSLHSDGSGYQVHEATGTSEDGSNVGRNQECTSAGNLERETLSNVHQAGNQ